MYNNYLISIIKYYTIIIIYEIYIDEEYKIWKMFNLIFFLDFFSLEKQYTICLDQKYHQNHLLWKKNVCRNCVHTVY